MTSDLLSILILTRNEEAHIARCLESAFRLTKSVFVLDSNSVDNTAEIVKHTNATLISGDFSSFAEKFNWGLENIEFKTPWVMRLDADELLSDRLITQTIPLLHSLDPEVVGIYVKRQLWFMGRWIRFGGMYPTYSMRILRPEAVSCEIRNMDEHIILHYGRHISLDADLMDIPLTDLSSWIVKHVEYASLEAKSSVLGYSSGSHDDDFMNLFGTFPQRIRWFKVRIFYRMPLFVRPVLYFIYRYFVRLGFLDGKNGFVFHFMHGLWYRILIDAKIVENKQKRQQSLTRGGLYNPRESPPKKMDEK